MVTEIEAQVDTAIELETEDELVTEIESEVETEDEAIEIVVNPSSTSELTTTEDFLIESTAELNIDVSISELEYQRAYINVCHSTEDNKIDYSNCVIQKPLKDGSIYNQVTIGNEVDNLHMEVWSYEVNSIPRSFTWKRDYGLDWVVY